MTLLSSDRQVVAIVDILVIVMVKDDLVAPTDGAGMKYFTFEG
jgi:hypothetical protein